MRGLVKGSTVQTKNFGWDFMSGMKTLVGGELTSYTEMIGEARQITTGRMVKEAEALGVDAVIGMRYTAAAVSCRARRNASLTARQSGLSRTQYKNIYMST